MQGCGWTCHAFNFSFYPFFLSSICFHRCWSQGHFLDDLHTEFCLRACKIHPNQVTQFSAHTFISQRDCLKTLYLQCIICHSLFLFISCIHTRKCVCVYIILYILIYVTVYITYKYNIECIFFVYYLASSMKDFVTLTILYAAFIKVPGKE